MSFKRQIAISVILLLISGTPNVVHAADAPSSDKKNDAELFKKECDLGDLHGCTKLGALYKHGDGVEKSYPKANTLFKKACDLGDAWGCNWLGGMYEWGSGVEKSWEKAKAYYKKSCDQGNKYSCSKLEKNYVPNTLSTPSPVPASAAAPIDDTAALFAKMKDAVVKLEVDELTVPTSMGSGFFVSSDGWIVTNRHVFQDVVKKGHGLTVSTIDGFKTKDFAVSGCSQNIDLDLCVIKINYKPKAFFTLQPKPSMQIGQKVFVIGHPEGYSFSMSDGVLSGMREKLNGVVSDRGTAAAEKKTDAVTNIIQVSAAISHGNSGGPIFNAKGELLGVATFFRVDGQNLNFGMDASEVYTFVNSHKKPITLAEFQKSMSESVTKVYQALIMSFASKKMKTSTVKLRNIEAVIPEFMSKSCKMVVDQKQGAMMACTDQLGDGNVMFGTNSEGCPVSKFPSFSECIRTRIVKDIDRPAPVLSVEYLIKKNSANSNVSSRVPIPTGDYAVSKPGRFDCHWSGDHEICTLKVENDHSPGSLGIWYFYRHRTLGGTVFAMAHYSNMEAEKYALMVSNSLVDRMSESVTKFKSKVDSEKSYTIQGIVIRPLLMRPDNEQAYLGFDLRTDLGHTYTVKDYVYPTIHIKPGQEMRAGRKYIYTGPVVPDPAHTTDGLLITRQQDGKH